MLTLMLLFIPTSLTTSLTTSVRLVQLGGSSSFAPSSAFASPPTPHLHIRPSHHLCKHALLPFPQIIQTHIQYPERGTRFRGSNKRRHPRGPDTVAAEAEEAQAQEAAVAHAQTRAAADADAVQFVHGLRGGGGGGGVERGFCVRAFVLPAARDGRLELCWRRSPVAVGIGIHANAIVATITTTTTSAVQSRHRTEIGPRHQCPTQCNCPIIADTIPVEE